MRNAEKECRYISKKGEEQREAGSGARKESWKWGKERNREGWGRGSECV